MANNVILCFDDVCNEPGDAEQERALFGLGGPKDSRITHILKLYLLFDGNFQQGTTVFTVVKGQLLIIILLLIEFMMTKIIIQSRLKKKTKEPIYWKSIAI